MDIEELKRLAVAVVTSALAARSLDIEERLEQYGGDFKMLMDDVEHYDLYRVTSLLADMNAHMVTMISCFGMTTPEETMQWLAYEMLSTPTNEA